jgi:hypothetical protein
MKKKAITTLDNPVTTLDGSTTTTTTIAGSTTTTTTAAPGATTTTTTVEATTSTTTTGWDSGGRVWKSKSEFLRMRLLGYV